MKLFSKIKENLFSIFQTALIVLLVVLVIVFVGVLSFEYVETHTSKLLDLSSKNETLKFLGIGMGGVLIALQALMSYKRAKAMEKTAEAQADAAKAQADAAKAQADAVSKTEQGQRQDRLKNAIEHLGHESDSVRLGGAYELFHLAEDTEDLRQTVLDILCAHIRRTTGEDNYRETHKSKPSEEVQSLLTLLFVQEHEVFKVCHINLQGSYLNGADLSMACLKGAVLTESHMQGVSLDGAYLQQASLDRVHLQGASLIAASMQGVSLDKAHLQGAHLMLARLQEASLEGAHLQGASLAEAFLQGASLTMAHLQGTSLDEAFLQGALLTEAQLQGASLDWAHLQGAQSQGPTPFLFFFAQRMEELIGQETDLSGVVFKGGLSQEDVDSLIKDLSDEEANGLQEILTPHIDKPLSHQLPEDSGAFTGAYTKEEAEQWIAEYEGES
ncbi:MAG: pentapeptide repeat-containing protein [Gemmatimonadota bacterium]|nr:pentapeptide repeat-containing protein [Gemmatimonadota bacterium]